MAFFWRKNLSRVKNGTYIINIDVKNSKETHWVSLFIDKNTDLYFDCFVIEYVPQKGLKQNEFELNTK